MYVDLPAIEVKQLSMEADARRIADNSLAMAEVCLPVADK